MFIYYIYIYIYEIYSKLLFLYSIFPIQYCLNIFKAQQIQSIVQETYMIAYIYIYYSELSDSVLIYCEVYNWE